MTLLRRERSRRQQAIDLVIGTAAGLSAGEGSELDLEFRVSELRRERGDDGLHRLLQSHPPSRQLRQGRHRPVGDAAGVHHREEAHVGVEVEGEAVHRDPAGHPHPDGRHLSSLGPYPGSALLGPSLDSERRQCRDQGPLEGPHVGHDPFGVVEAHDGISDELTGPMERDVAAPVHIEDLRPGRSHRLAIGQQVGRIPVPSDREHRRMLHQQQIVVGGAAAGPPFVEATLEIPGLGVGQPPQPADTESRWSGHDHRLSASAMYQVSSCSQSHVSMFCLIRCRNSTAVEPSKARWSQVNPRYPM